jgi:hypothetical protein
MPSPTLIQEMKNVNEDGEEEEPKLHKFNKGFEFQIKSIKPNKSL